MAILDEAKLKLRRGKEHLYSLESETRKFWDSDPYTLVHERNGKDFPNLLRFKLTQTVPYHTWGLILGDAVHNIRSALDYIVWRLAGSHLDDTTTMFPIYAVEEKWNGTQWRFRDRPIHPDAHAYIQSLQPYSRPKPQRAKLWILQELDARDKHKLIAVTEAVARASHIGGSGQMQIPAEVVEGTFKDGAVIIEYADPPEACMNMKFEFAYRIMFERGILSDTEDFEVLSVLYGIAHAVDTIIDNFELRPDWFP